MRRYQFAFAHHGGSWKEGQEYRRRHEARATAAGRGLAYIPAPDTCRGPPMLAAELEDRLQNLAMEVGRYSRGDGPGDPDAFADWFWARADAILGEVGPGLREFADERIYDLADGALDAGLFGRR